MATRPDRRGLSLIELLAVLLIVAGLAAVGLPSMRAFMMQQRLKSTASELLTDIQLARNSAFAQADYNVGVAFASNDSVTCYAVVQVSLPASTNCDCTRTGINFCQRLPFNTPMQISPMKLVTIARSTGVTVAAGDTLYYQPRSGMTIDRLPKTFSVTASRAGQLSVTISSTGLASICVPAGNNVSGFPACS